MPGTKMRLTNIGKTLDLINDEIQSKFNDARNELHDEEKQEILKVDDENRKTKILRRKRASQYKINDLVVIKRTHFGPGLKFNQKYLEPYKIIKVKPNNTYDVENCAFFNEPLKIFTCAESIKLWTDSAYDIT